jgi:hypothetical protein
MDEFACVVLCNFRRTAPGYIENIVWTVLCTGMVMVDGLQVQSSGKGPATEITVPPKACRWVTETMCRCHVRRAVHGCLKYGR